MDATPEIGGRRPLGIDVEAGKSYWWCACGRSKSQPFCDGSHKGTAFSPVEWKAERAEQAWFCACKRTGNRPMCDGSHKKLCGAENTQAAPPRQRFGLINCVGRTERRRSRLARLPRLARSRGFRLADEDDVALDQI